MKCILCSGSGYSTNVYVKGACPRCKATGVEPADPPLHPGMLVRNRRSGKVWAVFADYSGNEWGVHRFKPSVRGGHYVWQIQVRTAEQLLDTRRWTAIGVGDAWNHELMKTDPV